MRDPPMLLGAVPIIVFLGGGPLFETLRCQLFKAGKSICLVGDHFRDLTMPIIQGREIDFLGGGPLFETLRCHFFKAGNSISSGGPPVGDESISRLSPQH